MKIEWVNHASFILEHDSLRLISDPWIEGSVFHNGWKHLIPSEFRYEDYANITHIWFSHEHPDHFFPPNITKIDSAHRAQITVIYQETEDRKVVEFCRKLGFKDVIELQPNSWLSLTDDFKVCCGPFGHDSWLCVKGDGLTLLNTNDCVVKSAEDAEGIKDVTGEVDILATQFSYAQWEGNEDDPASRQRAADDKLSQITNQVQVFKPKTVIPFASYVWFSHEENAFMNDCANTVGKIYEFLKTLGVTPVVLYPGERWTIGDVHDSVASVEKYTPAYTRIAENPELTKAEKIDIEELQAVASKFAERAQERVGLYFKYRLNPLRIYLTDYEESYNFSVRQGLVKVARAREDNDVALSSEVLHYCLKFDWGFNTTKVNGRFHVFHKDALANFSMYESIGDLLNHDEYWPSIGARVLRKLTGARPHA